MKTEKKTAFPALVAALACAPEQVVEAERTIQDGVGYFELQTAQAVDGERPTEKPAHPAEEQPAP